MIPLPAVDAALGRWLDLDPESLEFFLCDHTVSHLGPASAVITHKGQFANAFPQLQVPTNRIITTTTTSSSGEPPPAPSSALDADSPAAPEPASEHQVELEEGAGVWFLKQVDTNYAR